MPVITTIDDLKQIYKRRVPKMFYDYAETGSWTEQTFLENSADFQRFGRNFFKFQSKSSFFMPIFMKFHQNFTKISQNFSKFLKLVARIFQIQEF